MTIGHWVFASAREHCKMGKARKALEHEFWYVDQLEQFGDAFIGLYGYESARLISGGQGPGGVRESV